ncbi:hypothetical protein J2T17_003666 [Paenibacillus mucilaginosus]|uniref:copper amine oxidase N-terminal domain-containing protein n=1 Tax=Paenibacillus mucilaginosus TaxID=61624 RepID=UPI003D1F3947
MNRKTKWISCLLAAGMMIPPQPAAAGSEPPAAEAQRLEIVMLPDERRVTVNGKTMELQAAPLIREGTTLVPLRFIAEALGTEVQWEASSRSILLSRGEQTIRLTLDQSTALVNGSAVPLEQPPVLWQEVTMVPLRFISERMDQSVSYDPASRTIRITAKETGRPPQTPEAAAAADPVEAMTPDRTRMVKPTVDNLTLPLGDPVVPGPHLKDQPYHLRTERFYSLESGTDRLFMIDHDSNRPLTARYMIQAYTKEYGKRKQLEPVTTVDERFTIRYKNSGGQENTLTSLDLVPQKLFYDKPSERLYMMAGTLNREVKTLIYQVLPEVKLISYDLDDPGEAEDRFFARLGEGRYLYSNSFMEKIYMLEEGRERRTTGFLSSPRKPKHTAAVHEGSLYLLDAANQTISKMREDGSPEKAAEFDLEGVLGVASTNGFFFAATAKGFYCIDVTGRVEPYAVMDELIYNRGLFTGEQEGNRNQLQGMEPYSRLAYDYERKLYIDGPAGSKETLVVGPLIDFAVDGDGNILLYDPKLRLIRRINVYPPSLPGSGDI